MIRSVLTSQRRGYHVDLMALVERFVIQGIPEALVKVVGETAPRGEAAVDLVDIFAAELLHPPSVIQRLGHDFARCAISLQFNEDQRAIRGNCQQIRSTPESGICLPADEHPFVGKQSRSRDDHVFKELFAGQ